MGNVASVSRGRGRLGLRDVVVVPEDAERNADSCAKIGT